jgi:serine/threonine protein kinase
MSPEQVLGMPVEVESRLRFQSDIYALGAVLRFMLTGHDPYMSSETTPGARRRDILSQVLDDSALPTPLPSTVSGRMRAIVQKAMAREPLARYTSAIELAQDLEAFYRDRPLQIPHPHWRPLAAALFVKRNRLVISVLCAALLVSATFVYRSFENWPRPSTLTGPAAARLRLKNLLIGSLITSKPFRIAMLQPKR